MPERCLLLCVTWKHTRRQQESDCTNYDLLGILIIHDKLPLICKTLQYYGANCIMRAVMATTTLHKNAVLPKFIIAGTLFPI